jgi:hypothetical protein
MEFSNTLWYFIFPSYSCIFLPCSSHRVWLRDRLDTRKEISEKETLFQETDLLAPLRFCSDMFGASFKMKSGAVSDCLDDEALGDPCAVHSVLHSCV